MELIYCTIFIAVTSVTIPLVLSLVLLIFPRKIREKIAAGYGVIVSFFVIIIALQISHYLLLKLYNLFFIYIMISFAMTFGHIIIKKFIFGQKTISKEVPTLGYILTYQWLGYSILFWIIWIIIKLY